MSKNSAKSTILTNEIHLSEGKRKTFRALRAFVMLGIGIGLLYLLLNHVSLNYVVTILSQVNLLFILMAAIVVVCITVLRVARYRWFFPTQHRWRKLYGAFALARLLTYSLPLRSGELVYVAMLKKQGFAPSIAELTPVWLLLRVTDLVALAVLLSLSLIFHPLEDSYKFASWIFSGIAFSLLVGLIGISIFGEKYHFHSKNSWLVGRFHKFQEGLHRINGLSAHVRTLLLSLLIWILMAINCTFLQIAFGTPLSFQSSFFVALITMTLGLLPIHAPLGIGTGEALWTGVFKIFGVPTAEAIGLAVAVRLVIILFISLEGFIGLAITSIGSTSPQIFSKDKDGANKNAF